MNRGNDTPTERNPSLAMWMLRKFAPPFLIAAGIGFAISFLGAKTPALLKSVAIVAGIGFGLVSVLYFYWAFKPSRSDRYQWTTFERIGVGLSGLGALVVAVKLVATDTFPGSTSSYFIGGALLAFVGRPFFNYLSSRNRSSEVAGDQPAAAPKLKVLVNVPPLISRQKARSQQRVTSLRR